MPSYHHDNLTPDARRTVARDVLRSLQRVRDPLDRADVLICALQEALHDLPAPDRGRGRILVGERLGEWAQPSWNDRMAEAMRQLPTVR